MASIAEHSLTEAPNILQQALSGKVAPVSKPAVKGSTKSQAKPAAKPALDNSQLDKQISELETELEQLDDSLTIQYQEIGELDKRYDAMEGKGGQSSQQAEQLKAQLKERVFKANDTLATLKSQHDELERLRIRRYSILA
jgi:chromosome segregation ATPase